jgi:hypothetical protein
MAGVASGCFETSEADREKRAGATGESGPVGASGASGPQGSFAGDSSNASQGGPGTDGLGDERDPEELWSSETGEDWEAFLEGHAEGLVEGCLAVVDSLGGTAYEEPPDSERAYAYRGTEWDSFDCERLDEDPDDVPYSVPFDPYDEGFEIGLEEGCEAVFDDSFSRELFDEQGRVVVDVYECGRL